MATQQDDMDRRHLHEAPAWVTDYKRPGLQPPVPLKTADVDEEATDA